MPCVDISDFLLPRRRPSTSNEGGDAGAQTSHGSTWQHFLFLDAMETHYVFLNARRMFEGAPRATSSGGTRSCRAFAHDAEVAKILERNKGAYTRRLKIGTRTNRE